MQKIVIIGGNGFVGQHLYSKLKDIYDLSIVDINYNLSKHINNFYVVDITNYNQLIDILNKCKPDLIICLASYGMSGSAMLDDKCEDVNVNGIKNIINACIETNVKRLIYTSTYNVIYGGNEIILGDENMPYYPVNKHSDKYSSSKTKADKIVLQSNSLLLSNKFDRLCTSIIRPAAIYGEQEQRHFPRIVKLMDLGLFFFRIGNAMVDWVYIDNLIVAYNNLIEKMFENDDCNNNPNGHAYFISDGTPISNFEFFRSLCIARGISYPSLIIQTKFMLYFAYMNELLYKYMKSLNIKTEPFLTRAEVLKVGYSHYFSINKAITELDYKPIINTIEGSKRMSDYYRQNLTNENYFSIVSIYLYISIFLGLILLYIAAFYQSNSVNGFLYYNQILAYLIFRTQFNLQLLFYIALLIHIIEGIVSLYYTLMLLRCKNTWYLWWIQTTCLGYPSLSLLINRYKWCKVIKQR